MADKPVLDLKEWMARRGRTLAPPPTWQNGARVEQPPPEPDDLPDDVRVDPAQVLEDALRSMRVTVKRLREQQARGVDVVDDLVKVAKGMDQLLKARGELADRAKKAACRLRRRTKCRARWRRREERGRDDDAR